MRITLFCRRFLCLLLICLLMIPVAQAEVPDISRLTDDEVIVLLGKVNEEIVRRGIAKSADLPAGKYVGGRDLPAGSYIITCKTDENHHGIIWVSAAADDLDNQYPSILYDHVGFSSEEQYRVSIEEGGILNLPFAATVTISAGLFFK